MDLETIGDIVIGFKTDMYTHDLKEAVTLLEALVCAKDDGVFDTPINEALGRILAARLSVKF